MWIEALRIKGGVLDGLDQRFTPKLNVLIGGRGTGKSSVIELIRFCLWATPSSDASPQQSLEHALGVLGDGRVVVTLTDGNQRLDISRTAQIQSRTHLFRFRRPTYFPNPRSRQSAYRRNLAVAWSTASSVRA